MRKKSYIAILTLPPKRKGMANEYGTNGFFTINRFFTQKTISQMYRPLSRELWYKEFFMLGSIPLYGFRSDHLSREFARYTDMPSCGSKQTLSYWHPFVVVFHVIIIVDNRFIPRIETCFRECYNHQVSGEQVGRVDPKFWNFPLWRPAAFDDVAHNRHAAGGRFGFFEVVPAQVVIERYHCPILHTQLPQRLRNICGKGYVIHLTILIECVYAALCSIIHEQQFWLWRRHKI